jgi:hypothetical protein
MRQQSSILADFFLIFSSYWLFQQLVLYLTKYVLNGKIPGKAGSALCYLATRVWAGELSV